MDRNTLAIVLALAVVGGAIGAPAAAAADPVEDAFSTVETDCSDDGEWLCVRDHPLVCEAIRWAINTLTDAGGKCT